MSWNYFNHPDILRPTVWYTFRHTGCFKNVCLHTKLCLLECKARTKVSYHLTTTKFWSAGHKYYLQKSRKIHATWAVANSKIMGWDSWVNSIKIPNSYLNWYFTNDHMSLNTDLFSLERLYKMFHMVWKDHNLQWQLE